MPWIAVAATSWSELLAFPVLGLWVWIGAIPLVYCLRRCGLTWKVAFGLACSSAAPVLLQALGFQVVLPQSWIDSAKDFRAELAGSVKAISPDAGALVLGLTTGDDSSLSPALKANMRLLSLTHLTAVSGTNCSIVVLACFALASALQLRRSMRITVAGLALVLYVWLVGPEPSVIRAGLMAMVVLLALSAGNRYRAIAVLGLAVWLALLLWPPMATSLGFALSVVATLAVLELAPRLAKILSPKLPAWIRLGLSAVLAAQVACLPILVWIQPSFSLLSILANLLVEPMVPAVTVLGVLGVLSFVPAPPLSQALFYVASLLAQFMVAIANWLSGIDLAVQVQHQALGFAISLLVLISVVALALGKLGSRLALSTLVILSLLLFLSQLSHQIAVAHGLAPNWFMVACDVGQGDATLIRSAGSVALVDVGPEAKLVNRCLERAGVRDIQLLVLTHYDLDHVGGLSGLLAAHHVETALVTDYRDDRPGAEVVGELLRANQIETRAVHAGDTGMLGQTPYLVLNPPREGSEVEDSNDGSVVARWDFGWCTVLTMADLGERGQMRMAEFRQQWWTNVQRELPLILKVSHHGSADQYPELFEWLRPQLVTISAGQGNPYGHPTQRTLDLFTGLGSQVARTDLLGTISVYRTASGQIGWSTTGR